MISVKHYRVTLNSDTGRYSITTAATEPDEAAKMICDAQRAPRSAVRAIVEVDRKGRKIPQKPQLYAVEFTDTFGGEANYCWAQRFRVWATDIGQAITRAKQHRYNSPLPRHTLTYCDSDDARIDIKNAPVCAFIRWTEPTEHAPGDGEIINPDQAPAEHRPQWWEQSTSLGLISLQLTPAEAIEATPAGQDAQPYITALMQRQDIKTQLDAIPAEAMREYLTEAGAWTPEELANDSDNRERLLWVAACDIAEEYRSTKPEYYECKKCGQTVFEPGPLCDICGTAADWIAH